MYNIKDQNILYCFKNPVIIINKYFIFSKNKKRGSNQVPINLDNQAPSLE